MHPAFKRERVYAHAQMSVRVFMAGDVVLGRGNMRRGVVSLHPEQNTDCDILPN